MDGQFSGPSLDQRWRSVQFVGTIQAKPEIKWRHILTEEILADLASRGGDVQHKELWWNGPERMAKPENWPQDIVSQSSAESQAETSTDQLDLIIEKYELTKAIKIMA